MEKQILIKYLENSLIKIENKQKINIDTINNIAKKYIYLSILSSILSSILFNINMRQHVSATARVCQF